MVCHANAPTRPSSSLSYRRRKAHRATCAIIIVFLFVSLNTEHNSAICFRRVFVATGSTASCADGGKSASHAVSQGIGLCLASVLLITLEVSPALFAQICNTLLASTDRERRIAPSLTREWHKIRTGTAIDDQDNEDGAAAVAAPSGRWPS
jgi:hypothetical protein